MGADAPARQRCRQELVLQLRRDHLSLASMGASASICFRLGPRPLDANRPPLGLAVARRHKGRRRRADGAAHGRNG